MKISKITVNHLNRAIGVDPDNAHIYWMINGRGMQSAFRIVLKPHSGAEFNSGIINSAIQSYSIPPVELQGCTVYTVDLTVWDMEGNLLNLQQERFLITALDRPFTGGWIWKNNIIENQHVYCRNILPPAENDLIAAIAFVSADDYYKLSIDGKYVGEGPTKSLVNSCFYNTWDITSAITPGQKSMFGIHAYYMGKENWAWVSGDNNAGVIAEVHYIYKDRSEIVLKTDSSWEIQSCQHFMSSHLLGYDTAFSENIDARKFIKGWDTLNSRNAHWKNATEVKDPPWSLVPQTTNPLSIYEIKPERIQELNPGHYIIDFGKEYVGCPAITARGERGSQFQVRLGEELNPDGSVRFDIRAFCLYQERFTLSGGEDYFEQYDYKAFRYAELIDYPEKLTPDKIKIIARNNPFDERNACFSSSEETLNDVWEICKHGLKLCTQDVYVDCPTREKAQYAGDLYIQGRASYLIAGEYILQKHALDNFFNSFDEQDLVSAHCPSASHIFSTDYGFILFLIARHHYDETGDVESVKRWLPSLERILNRWKPALLPNGLLGDIAKHTNHPERIRTFLDWPANLRADFEFCEVNTPLNALYYGALQTLVYLFNEIGANDRSKSYAQKANTLRTAINASLIDYDGLYLDGIGSKSKTFHATLYPLWLGISPEDLVEKQLAYLMKCGMSCGVYCGAFFLETLYRYKKSEYALDLLRAKDGNSWGSMLSIGATTCTEVWKLEQKMNMSWCHAWSCSPLYILPTLTSGIRPLSPGYKQILINPQPADLENIETSINTIRGRICVKFRQQDDLLIFDLTIPFGSKCTFTWNNGGIDKAILDNIEIPFQDHLVIPDLTSGNHTIILEKSIIDIPGRSSHPLPINVS
jgi:alpha-L-rhamnosidase